ncbi:uncharacterized protein LOC128419858 [Podarcis raffonei]|uniref:uncharacterized protein LOC128419858 n=1 Tax=Podarcis raffonei TaxID=65483 RepID=UPI0023298503|nr:uncharacterized protein LOC128419858 [Podarcis raffonei]
MDRRESLVPRRGTMMGMNVFGGLAWAMNSPPLPSLCLSVSFSHSFFPAQTVGQKETYFARMRRAHKQNSTSLTEEQLRKDVAAGRIPSSGGRVRRATQVQEAQLRRDAEIWEMLSRWQASSRRAPPPPKEKEEGAPKLPPAGLRTPSAAQAAHLGPPRSFASLARAPVLPASLAAAPGSQPQGQGIPGGRSSDSSSNLLSSSQYRLRLSEAKKVPTSRAEWAANGALAWRGV